MPATRGMSCALMRDPDRAFYFQRIHYALISNQPVRACMVRRIRYSLYLNRYPHGENCRIGTLRICSRSTTICLFRGETSATNWFRYTLQCGALSLHSGLLVPDTAPMMGGTATILSLAIYSPVTNGPNAPYDIVLKLRSLNLLLMPNREGIFWNGL